MKIDFITKNCEASEHLKRITEQKLSKLDKYFGENDAQVKVRTKKEGSFFTTEVTLDYCTKFVRASATGDNFYDNLDKVLPKLEGQIRKYRTRFDKHSKNSAFREAGVFEGELAFEQAKSNIVREKKFKLTPMTVNEAIEELDLLGHSFYVFKEAKSGTVQVLYRRNDGDLALIETE